MDDLVQWLRAQLDEDERIAKAVGFATIQTGEYLWGSKYLLLQGEEGSESKVTTEFDGDLAAHVARHDPARVLREIDAKRQLLDDYTVTARIRDEAAERIKAAGDHPDSKDLETWDRAQREAAILEGPVRLAALPLSDRPGYREEWRP